MWTSRTVRLASIGGIEIRLAPSLLVVVVAVVWTFAERFRPEHGTAVGLVMASTFAVLFFATILAHELAHALEARHRHIEVRSITLLFFGGVTEMDAHSERPRDEFVVAAVGPWVSLLCGAAFGLLATFAGRLFVPSVASPVAEVAGLLGWWNVLLAVFNLVPGAPLDGGRVLRAGLWWLLGDRLRALRIAVRCGQALGIVLAGLGGYAALRAVDLVGRATAGPTVGPPVATSVGALVAGPLLFVVLGGFLFVTARAELRHAETDAALAGRTVAELLGRPPAGLPADRTLDGVDLIGRAGTSALLPVVDETGLVGVLDVATVVRLHPTDLSVRTARDLADPIDGLPSVELSEDLHTLIDRFQGEHHVLALTDGGVHVGAVTEREAATAIGALRRRVRR